MVAAPFFVVGFVGLFIPILQGLLFLGIGVFIVASENPRVAGWVRKKLEPYPRANRLFKKYVEGYLTK